MIDVAPAPLLLDFATDILLAVDADTLEIRAANKAALDQLGYTQTELIGRPITEVECALADLFYWEEVRNGTSADLHDAEGMYQKADGEMLVVTKSVMRAPQQPNFLVIRAKDISQEKHTEEELAHLASQLRATLEATVDGILVLNRQGRVTNMNRRFAQMWKVPNELLQARSDQHLLGLVSSQLADVEQTSARLAAIRTDEDGDSFDTLMLSDGRIFECKSRPARNGEQLIGRVFCFTDVTERAAAERALIAARDAATSASRAKGDFLAMMSHEIRTPMNGILGMAQLLEGSKLDEEQSDFVRTMRSSCEALLSIINDILDYSKIEARKLELETTPFSLSILMGDIAKIFGLTARNKGLEYVSVLAPNLPDAMLGDPVRLRQILVNLIGNAFKFTEKGGVEVSVREESRAKGVAMLRFAVKDSGIGIHPDKLGNIFTPFEQADMSITRRFGGTGLGLSISRMLTELMGGTIAVESVAGQGSTFWFTASLGLGEESKALAAQPAAVEMAMPLDADVRILVVEDNLVNITVISNLLKKLGGKTITTAKNGLLALEACSKAEFDVIFMDTHMPEMDGHTATRRLREAGNTTHIIGVSADAMTSETNAALEAGMNDYVTKPVSLDALRRSLERWRALGSKAS